MFSSSDEEENEHRFHYWNKWKPPEKSRNAVFERSQFFVPDSKTTTTWIPPFNRKPLKRRRSSALSGDPDFSSPAKKSLKTVDESVIDTEEITQPKAETLEDWGPPFPYAVYLNSVNDGVIIWRTYPVAVFGNFRLSRNDLGVITANAEAEISNTPGTQVAMLLVNNEIHLRKLLGIGHDEWSALKDALGQTKWNLHYEAIKPINIAKLKPMDKLWYYICKRRQYLPSVAIKMRRSGIHKMTQFLKMLPKFVVVDIKTFSGQDIH